MRAGTAEKKSHHLSPLLSHEENQQVFSLLDKNCQVSLNSLSWRPGRLATLSALYLGGGTCYLTNYTYRVVALNRDFLYVE